MSLKMLPHSRPSLSSISSSRRKSKKRQGLVCVAASLAAAIILFGWSFLLRSTSRSGESRGGAGYLKHPRRRPFHHTNEKKGAHRIAIIIPFAGTGVESLPPYLDLFISAANGSAALVDFIIVHNGAMKDYTEPSDNSNVKFVDLGSSENMAKYLLRVMDKSSETSKIPLKNLSAMLAQQISLYPYVLVEYKPALGHIFAQYIPREKYTHWGYSDLDIIMGDLPRWITPDELNDFDVVTYGYGDQDRVYLRGQFTFHKNNDKVNQLWRDCEYLSRMDERFEGLLSKTNKKGFSLESAEGCYSAAILSRSDVSVKYAVKAFNDISKEDTTNTHGVYLAFGSDHSSSVIFKYHRSGQHTTPLLPYDWFEQPNDPYHSDSLLQMEIGTRTQLVLTSAEKQRGDAKSKKSRKCMYWAQAKYQEDICMTGKMKSTDTVFWVNGKMYKQPYQNMLPQREHHPNVETAPFFHFQEWKRYYRSMQLSSCHRHGMAVACMLTKEGSIPLFPARPTPLRSGMSASPRTYRFYRWKGGENVREQLPTRQYCLQSAPRKYPPKPPSSECKWSISWRDVELLSNAPAWNHIDESKDITLTLTLQISSLEASSHDSLNNVLDVLVANAVQWRKGKKPCVVVIHVSGATDEIVESVRGRFEESGDLWIMSLVGVIFSDGEEMSSRKSLLNMAREAVPTRWMITGIELERGLVLSREAYQFSHASTSMFDDTQGTIMMIPQFSVSSEEDSKTSSDQDAVLGSSLSVSTLLQQHEKGGVRGPDVLNCGFCEDGEGNTHASIDKLYDLWHVMTSDQTEGVLSGEEEAASVALQIEEFQQTITSFLAVDDLKEVGLMNISPIILLDNVGPHVGMRTVEMAREVEEFGGMKCYNGLWLAQLVTLGYTVQLLPGAFAASSVSSRRVACRRLSSDGVAGTSRCDGCFMFDEGHSNILNAIARDERIRPAKAAVLLHATGATSALSQDYYS